MSGDVFGLAGWPEGEPIDFDREPSCEPDCTCGYSALDESCPIHGHLIALADGIEAA